MTEQASRLDHPDGELRWVRDRRWVSVPTPTTRTLMTDHDHLLVVAAHPDDECLGAGAFIADAAALGADVTVLILTDGEASHPRSPTVGRKEMASRRRTEAVRAIADLAPRARVVHAGLPDGGLADRHDDIATDVRNLCTPGTFVLAPWTSDGHPDHDAAGRAVRAAVESHRPVTGGVGRPGLGHYLIWFWHWGVPDQLPWSDLVAVDATVDGLTRRARAVRQHSSQVLPLSTAAGDEATMTDAALTPFSRGFTTLVLPDHHDRVDPFPDTFAESDRTVTFDAMFDNGEDPWSSDTWYERRKRALTLAVLRRERYERVLDLGCSTGVLTRDLASRADEVVGIDVSQRAIDIADRGTGQRHTWIRGEAPSVLDELTEPFDLIVVSEVGYFLRPFELWLTLGGLIGLLAPGGELVLVHWRHPTREIPLDGPWVHTQVRAVCEPWSVVAVVEDDVLLDVYVAPR